MQEPLYESESAILVAGEGRGGEVTLSHVVDLFNILEDRPVGSFRVHAASSRLLVMERLQDSVPKGFSMVEEPL